MSRTTKSEEILDVYENEFEKLSKSIFETSTSYEFETKFNILFKKFGQSIYHCLLGKVSKSKNEQITILSSMRNVRFPKTHCLATVPGGFKISQFMQEHLCRIGTKMTFTEASEEITHQKGKNVVHPLTINEGVKSII